VSNFTQCTS